MAGFTPNKKLNTDFNGGAAYRNKVDTPSAQDLNNLIEGLLFAQENGAGGDVPTKVSQLENDAGYITNVPFASNKAIGGFKTNRFQNEDSGSIEFPLRIDENGFGYVYINKISTSGAFGLVNVFKSTHFISSMPEYNQTEVKGRYYAVESWNGYLVVNVPWESANVDFNNYYTKTETDNAIDTAINNAITRALEGEY